MWDDVSNPIGECYPSSSSPVVVEFSETPLAHHQIAMELNPTSYSSPWNLQNHLGLQEQGNGEQLNPFPEADSNTPDIGLHIDHLQGAALGVPCTTASLIHSCQNLHSDYLQKFSTDHGEITSAPMQLMLPPIAESSLDSIHQHLSSKQNNQLFNKFSSGYPQVDYPSPKRDITDVLPTNTHHRSPKSSVSCRYTNNSRNSSAFAGGYETYRTQGRLALHNTHRQRSKQGCANDPQSIAARVRRERISERLKILQDLVPNGSKVDLVTMLEKAINYVKCLQLQIKVLTADEFWPKHAQCVMPKIMKMEEALEGLASLEVGEPGFPIFTDTNQISKGFVGLRSLS